MIYDESNTITQKALNINNINELIGKKISIGNDYLIITGIIKDNNLEKFKSLKNESLKELEFKPTKLYKEFLNTYKECNILVNENFFEVSPFEENLTISSDLFSIVNKIDNKNCYLTVYSAINKEITYFDGKNFIKTNKLNPGEVIISTSVIEEYNSHLYNKAEERYKRELKEYKEKLSTCENNCDFIKEPSLKEIAKEMYTRYINESNLIEKNIILEIKDEHHYITDDTYTSIPLKIVGINFDSEYSYVDKSIIKDYLLPNELISSIQLNDLKESDLEKLFNEFNKEDKTYQVTSAYSNSIDSVASVISSINKISNYLIVASLTFAIILLTVFISLNINTNKKKLGILRALGASIKDVISIFIMEALIIGASSFIISNFLSILLINITNNFITKEIYFYLKPLVFNPLTTIIILALILLIIFISLVLPIIHLAKQKPVYLINK